MKSLYNKLINFGTYGLLILFSLGLYIVLLLGSQDNDMFFEIMSGQDLLNGNFSTATHLDNFPMTIQQWLYSVLLAIFDNFGYIGHIACVLIQNMILIALSVIFIKLKSNHNTLTAVSLSLLSLLYCCEYLINIRPQIITMILLMSQLILLELYKKHNKMKYLALIIPILILAANFHQAVFLYHILLLVPYYIDSNNKYFLNVPVLVATPIYLLCSLCTPYGLDGSLYILRTFKSRTYELYAINELGPMTPDSFVGMKFMILVIITICLIYFHKSNKQLNIYIIGLLILSMISIRHVTIMYIPLMFIICSVDFKSINTAWTRVALSMLFIFLAICFSGSAHDLRKDYEQIETIIENKDARIYNSAMDVGGFLEYNGYTKIRIDSRCEAFSEEISGVENVNQDMFAVNKGYIVDLDKHIEFASDEYILDIVNDYDYIVADTLDHINRVVEDNNQWVEIHRSNSYIVWENCN